MKKKKLSFAFVADLGYCNFNRAKVNGVPGWSFILCSPLTSELKKFIKSFDNTRIGTRTCLQAPEQKKDIVFLGAKCF